MRRLLDPQVALSSYKERSRSVRVKFGDQSGGLRTGQWEVGLSSTTAQSSRSACRQARVAVGQAIGCNGCRHPHHIARLQIEASVNPSLCCRQLKRQFLRVRARLSRSLTDGNREAGNEKNPMTRHIALPGIVTSGIHINYLLILPPVCKLSRLAGVSEAGTRWRNPERSEGSPAERICGKNRPEPGSVTVSDTIVTGCTKLLPP